MFVRQRLAKSAVFLLLLGMLSTFYPIRNASDQLNNKEASGLPAGLLRTVVMLFVARWWASNISSFSEDPATQLQAAFVLLEIPSLVLTLLGWFAGGERKWRSTPVSKVLGIVVLAIGVLTVRGVLFA